jgi:hypothetical protein
LKELTRRLEDAAQRGDFHAVQIDLEALKREIRSSEALTA